ncbi:MAG: hypothetical protein RBT02_12905 [Bacteroidales bacterium]|jgi:hypothetical protein|nr:hypothetical protein [Bacteroidales bacterium]
MNQLVLRDKAQEYIFRFLGGLTLLGVGIQLFTNSSRRAIFWILVVVFIVVAIMFLTLLMGAYVNRLTVERGRLTVRWNTIIFKKHIRIDEITGVTEDKNFIRILKKDGKSIRLRVRLLDRDRRRTVRKFLKENTGF